jgi:hypothetical protein
MQHHVDIKPRRLACFYKSVLIWHIGHAERNEGFCPKAIFSDYILWVLYCVSTFWIKFATTSSPLIVSFGRVLHPFFSSKEIACNRSTNLDEKLVKEVFCLRGNFLYSFHIDVV